MRTILLLLMLMILTISCSTKTSFSINADSIERPNIHFTDSTFIQLPK